MSWRNNSRNTSENAFEKFFNKKNNNKKDSKKDEIKEVEKPLVVQIEEINKILNSGKYMSKTKKDNLLKQLEELKIKKENEFPDLVKPIVFNNTPQRSVESIWGKPLDKIKCTDGIDEMNRQLKIQYAEERKERERKKELEKQRKYYEKHKDDSDYEGEDFY